MAIAKKILKGAGKVLTQPNTIDNGGGLSSLIIPRMVNAKGAALIVGGSMALATFNEGLKSHNAAKLGRIKYTDGPARMTKSFTTGGVQAMHRASGGNYAVFADMAEEVVAGNGFKSIDTYGATPALISALYNMGGR